MAAPARLRGPGRYGAAMEDLDLDTGHVVPGSELEWTFSPSGGPGGQHANRSATRAELRFDVEASVAFDGRELEQLMQRLGPRVRSGIITVGVDGSRSQWRNRQTARRRLRTLLEKGLEPEPPPRRRTKPSRSARRRRLEEKRARAQTKQLRKRPPAEGE